MTNDSSSDSSASLENSADESPLAVAEKTNALGSPSKSLSAVRPPRSQVSLEHGDCGTAYISPAGAKFRLSGGGHWTVTVRETAATDAPRIEFGQVGYGALQGGKVPLTLCGPLALVQGKQSSSTASDPDASRSTLVKGQGRRRGDQSRDKVSIGPNSYLVHCNRVTLGPTLNFSSRLLPVGPPESRIEICVPLGIELGCLSFTCPDTVWKDASSNPSDESRWARKLKVRAPPALESSSAVAASEKVE